MVARNNKYSFLQLHRFLLLIFLSPTVSSPEVSPGRADDHFCLVQHLSSTPVYFSGIIRRRIADPLHGSLTPAAVLTEPPNAVTRSRREYHYPFGCRRHTGGLRLWQQKVSLSITDHRALCRRGSCFHTEFEVPDE